MELENFSPFYLGVYESHIILYDKKGIAREFLNKIGNKIKSGEIVKKEDYWIIKREF